MQLPYRKPGKYTNQKNDPIMTQDKFDELVAELEKLKKERPFAAQEVARLAEMGDFSENVEYQLAKRRLRGINYRILILETQTNQAEIIENNGTDVIDTGNTVIVEVDSKEKTYTILGSSETDPAQGIISHNSPIGSALLRKKVGNVVEVSIAGKEKVFKIIKII